MTDQTSQTSDVLIINDGTLPGLVACYAEGVVQADRKGKGPDSGPTGQDAANRAGGVVAWMPLDQRPARRQRELAVRRQAGLCALRGVSIAEPLRLDLAWAEQALRHTGPGVLSGLEATRLLISAAYEAMSLGIGRVIWPVHAGGSDEPDLAWLADVTDRAMLVSQLAAIDMPRVGGPSGAGSPGAMSLRIETPYADFSDIEIFELALDMEVPLTACWWCEHEQTRHAGESGSPQPCGRCAECRRWHESLQAVDPQGLLSAEGLWGTEPVSATA